MRALFLAIPFHRTERKGDQSDRGANKNHAEQSVEHVLLAVRNEMAEQQRSDLHARYATNQHVRIPGVS